VVPEPILCGYCYCSGGACSCWAGDTSDAKALAVGALLTMIVCSGLVDAAYVESPAKLAVTVQVAQHLGVIGRCMHLMHQLWRC
jgi:hypothetical protein